MAATLSRVLERIISPIYSGLLIGLQGEFESKIKFITYAHVIRYSSRTQSCLVKSGKWAEGKSKYRMKFQKDTNNFLPCIIENGQILNAASLLMSVIWCRFSFPQHLLILQWKEKASQIPGAAHAGHSPSVWGIPPQQCCQQPWLLKLLEKYWTKLDLVPSSSILKIGRLGFAALWFS